MPFSNDYLKNCFPFILLVIFIVTGCDTVRGVTRVSYFEPYPSNNCILDSARGIDGVSEITYSKEHGGRRLTFHGIEKPDVIHRYWYAYKGINNDFYFIESYDGKVEFRHGYGCLHCYPPPEIVDIIYPFILELEKQLQEQCEIHGLISNAQEYCRGIKCPSV